MFTRILSTQLKCTGRLLTGTIRNQNRLMSSTVGYKLNEIAGNLFSAPDTASLAHCVAADFGMGAGIAVKFKQTFNCVDQLLQQNAKTGGMAVLQPNESRFVYYLVTKPKSSDKPSYENLQSSLEAMRTHMRANSVQSLAMPRIGCGIHGLKWDRVKSIINKVFCEENLNIIIYNFVPKGK